MTDFERQNAVSRELRDGDFSAKASLIDLNDSDTMRTIRLFGLTILVVFGLVSALAVLSV